MASEKKYITVANLKYYHQKLMLYIDEKATTMDDIMEIISGFSDDSYYVRYYDNFSVDQKIISVNKNETITVAVSPFTRPGYNFIYWSTNAEDTGVRYEPGDKITVTQNLSLFAQWETANDIQD